MIRNLRALFLFLLAFSLPGCYKEPSFGHLKLTVTYPQAVVVPNEPVRFVPSPGEGACVTLFDKDAICLGYKDATLNIAWLNDTYVGPKYARGVGPSGIVVLENLMPGEYLMIVSANKLYKYSELYVVVGGGDTLRLTKNFTPDLSIHNGLEHWFYEVPGY